LLKWFEYFDKDHILIWISENFPLHPNDYFEDLHGKLFPTELSQRLHAENKKVHVDTLRHSPSNITMKLLDSYYQEENKALVKFLEQKGYHRAVKHIRAYWNL